MTDTAPAYGLWGLVIINIAVFLIFAFSFSHPKSPGGFLLQWPTIVTLVLFPILLVMYARLALWEEKQMLKEFGEAYDRYREHTPAFVPRLSPLEPLRS